MNPVAVVGGVGSLLAGCLALADAVCAHKRNVRVLANRMKLLVPLLEEVQKHQDQIGTSVTPTLERMEEVLRKAHDLFAKCKNASRIYMIANSYGMTERFKDLTAELDGVISMLPMALLSVSQTIQEQVQVMRQELKGVQYTVEEGIAALSQDVTEALQAQKSNAPPAALRAKLRTLAKELHLTSHEELHREAMALLEEKRAAHNGKSSAEEENLERVLQLVKAMDLATANVATARPPEEYLCPITRELMTDPVFTASGQSYERRSIQQWFDMGHATDPLTGQSLDHSRLTPNYSLRSLIAAWKQQNNWREPDVSTACPADTLLPLPAPSAPPLPTYPRDTSAQVSSREVTPVTEGASETRPFRRSLSSTTAHTRHNTWTPGVPPSVDATTPEDPLDRTASVPESRSWQGPSTPSQASRVRGFVRDLQQGSSRRVAAAAQLRALSKAGQAARASIVEAGAVPPLIAMLGVSEESALQEAALAALLNLSVDNPQKTALVEAGVVPPLTLLLHMTDGLAVREAAAVLLFSLSAVQSPEVAYAARSAIDPLANLLSEGTPEGRKDSLRALFNTSIPSENKAPIVSAGLVPVLLDLVRSSYGAPQTAAAAEADRETRELAAGLLGSLAQSREGRQAVVEGEGIGMLCKALENERQPRIQEHSVALLLLLSRSSNSAWRVAVANTVNKEALHRLERLGVTPRARTKASELLSAVEQDLSIPLSSAPSTPLPLQHHPSLDTPSKPSRRSRAGSEHELSMSQSFS